MAEDQKYRHDELYKLAQEADDYITVIQSRSEEVSLNFFLVIYLLFRLKVSTWYMNVL